MGSAAAPGHCRLHAGESQLLFSLLGANQKGVEDVENCVLPVHVLPSSMPARLQLLAPSKYVKVKESDKGCTIAFDKHRTTAVPRQDSPGVAHCCAVYMCGGGGG